MVGAELKAALREALTAVRLCDDICDTVREACLNVRLGSWLSWGTQVGSWPVLYHNTMYLDYTGVSCQKIATGHEEGGRGYRESCDVPPPHRNES